MHSPYYLLLINGTICHLYEIEAGKSTQIHTVHHEKSPHYHHHPGDDVADSQAHLTGNYSNRLFHGNHSNDLPDYTQKHCDEFLQQALKNSQELMREKPEQACIICCPQQYQSRCHSQLPQAIIIAKDYCHIPIAKVCDQIASAIQPGKDY